MSDAAAGTRGLSAYLSRPLLAAILVSAGYYVAVHVGIALTFEPSPVSTLWPPNAVLLAGLLLTPWRTWHITIAAVLPAHFAAEIPLGVPWLMAACWFVSNVSEALIGAGVIVGALRRPPRFDRLRDLSVFLAGGVLLAPVLSSFLDTAFVALVDWRYSGFWQIWRTRLFSNVLATLTVVPLIGILYQGGRDLLRRATVAQIGEASALLLGISIAAVVVFLRKYSPGLEGLMFVPLPFMVWAALRFGVTGVSVCAAIVALFAITGALRGLGPFASTVPETLALTVQTFLIIKNSSLLLLAATLSELRQAREAAARNEEKLNLALDAAEGGTWQWDAAEDRITWASTGPEAKHGNAQPLVRSRPLDRLLRLVHENDRQAVEDALAVALTTGDSREVEFRFADGHSKHRWIAIKGRVLTDERGRPQCILGVYIDISRRKAQEAQTREQREQLAHLGRVSTLGELSGAIAHEINQPLNAILLNAQAALRELRHSPPRLADLAEMLEDIVWEDKRASEVIRRLRALLLRGKAEKAEVDVNECIHEVLRLEQADLVGRHIKLHLRLASGIPPALGDRIQLEQVLLNLLVNARDAMLENRPEDRKVCITTRQTDKEIEVEICDTGHGIADVNAIFEPFYSTKEHGIGMGLAICRSIVSAHGGRLWASNNTGPGATFHLLVPAATRAGTARGIAPR